MRTHVKANEKPPSVSAASTPKKKEDVAVVCGVSPDGKGVSILRKRGESIEAGTVRSLEPGKPIHGEVVRLKPRADSPLICDIEVEVEAPAGSASLTRERSAGPAQVASAQYRKNWDAIYKPRSAKAAINALPSSKTKHSLN